MAYVECQGTAIDVVNRPQAETSGPFSRSVLRVLLVMAGTLLFLLLLATTASALDVPDADAAVSDTTGTLEDTADNTDEASADTTGALDETAGAATGAVEDTAGAATGAVEDIAGAATGSVEDTAGAATGAVEDTAGAATGAVEDTAGAATGSVEDIAGAATGSVEDIAGAATGAVEDTAGAATETVGTATGGVTETVGTAADTVATTADGVLDSTNGLGDLVDVVVPGSQALPTAPLAPDPTTGSTGGQTDAPPAGGPLDGPSPLRHESLHTTLLNDFHPATSGEPRPDADGARPGPVPRDGLPFPLDAAAAALSSLTEAGGASLVWAFFALVALLAVTGDRWLRLAQAVPPLAPYVVQDGRPG